MSIRKASGKVTKYGLILLSLILLILSIAGLLFYFSKTYPRAWRIWTDAPLSVQLLSLRLELERPLHRIFPPDPDPSRYSHVTPETVDTGMRAGADWILSMQEPSGRFQYWYDPLNDRFSDRHLDNFLRQAGTSFSLMLVYEITGDIRYLDGARRSIDYLMQYKEDRNDDTAYFLFRRKAKLGGLSLPMLTMMKIRDLTGTSEYDVLLGKLANMILYLQELYGTGQYKSTYVYQGSFQYEKESGWESNIYPGEAMYALANMFRIFKDTRYKDSIDRALKFYSPKKEWKNHAFLPWTISAFTTLYEQEPENKYADYALLLTEHLLTQQNLGSGTFVYGSFHGIPTANTGSYLEGLGDAIHLANLLNDSNLVLRYKEHAKMGYRWLLELQYDGTSVSGLPNPQRAIGGVRKSIYDPQLRIDNTQHAISSFAKGLCNVFGIKPMMPSLLSR